MRTSLTLTFISCLTVAAAAACNDASNSPTAPAAPAAGVAPRALTSPAPSLDAEIRTIIATRYANPERAAIALVWNKIISELAESRKPGVSPAMMKREIAEARLLFIGLSSYLKATTPKVIPPAGETKEHVVARLALLMSLYVYGGPDTPPPVIPASADAVFAVVQPSATATQTITTPTQHAAVRFPPGSLGETRIVVVTQETVPYPVNCSGPLNTRLCQYPQFYKFDVFPDNKLLVPAVAAVCHINSGSSRAPLADHARFRLAHDAPVNATDRIPGGTIVDGIEILPYHEVSGLTGCEGNSYQVGAAPVAPRGPLGRTLHWVAEPVERVAAAIFNEFAPRTAYAIDGLGGGDLLVFSNFGVVDPAGAPDLAVTSEAPAFEGSFFASDTIPVGAWSITNSGTATAENVAASLVVAADSMLTSGVVARVNLASAASLAPRANLSGAAASIILPDSVPAGSYFVGVRVVSNSETGIPEGNYFNNRRTTRITIAPRLNPVIPIDPRSTFYTPGENDSALPAVILDLQAMGFAPGDQITLETAGSYTRWPGNPEYAGEADTDVVVVFSATNVLYVSSAEGRVPDRVSDDLTVARPGVTFTVPERGRYLFIGVYDSAYSDNTDLDHDFGIRVTRPVVIP